jgi:tRNA threonylcarbamoyladenosine biosynthesis protein TsaE
MRQVIKSASPEQTIEVGRGLGAQAAQGDTIALYGELGSGKTVLCKGIALGLQINDTITSPSFTIINEYEGRLPLFHIDLYRITGEEDFEALGTADFLGKRGLTVIEWPERAAAVLPAESISVSIKVEDDGSRTISIGRND